MKQSRKSLFKVSKIEKGMMVVLCFFILGMVFICMSNKEKNMKKYISFYYDMSSSESSRLLKDEDCLPSRWSDVVFGTLDAFVSEKGRDALIKNRIVEIPRTYVRLNISSVHVSQIQLNQAEENRYGYQAELTVKYIDGSTQTGTVSGKIYIQKENGKWKVNGLVENQCDLKIH